MRPHRTAHRRAFPIGPRWVLRQAWAYASSCLVRLVPPVRAAFAGEDPHAGSPQAAIYVSYHRWSLVEDYVVAQVAALAQAGRRVTFISNSPQLRAAHLARLRPYVREVVHRHNFGHDFGAYKDGIARLGDLAGLASLVLMNDSCYGPFGGLARVDEAAAGSGADLFGVTESWDVRYHLQTYYVWIGAQALRAPAFAAFWRRLLPSQPRSMVIANGEIRLTQALLRAGLRVGAMCPYSEAAQRALAAAQARLADSDALLAVERDYFERLSEAITSGQPLNPTHSFWDVLLDECGSPFLKRELLRRNPVRIPGVAQWERRLAPHQGADLDAIRNDLKVS